MLDVLFSRRSVRRWAPGPVSEEQLRVLLHAAMSAPSAGNEKAWQFVVLDSPHVLEHYLALNPNTPKGAPLGILVCGDLKAQRYEGYHVQDCAAATQNILLAAQALGLGAVWTTVFPHNIEGIRTLLSLPEQVVPFAFIPVGQVQKLPEVQDRFDDKCVHRNGW